MSRIRLCFSKMGIQVWQLKNISFIGNNICEIILHKKYSSSFIEIVKQAGIFKILKDFNPSCCIDPQATPELKASIKSKFIKRCQSIISHNTSPLIVKEFFTTMLHSVDPNINTLNSSSSGPASGPSHDSGPGSTSDSGFFSDSINYPSSNSNSMPTSSTTSKLQDGKIISESTGCSIVDPTTSYQVTTATSNSPPSSMNIDESSF